MAYPQKLLNPGEETIVDLHPPGGFRQRSPVSHHFSRPCDRCCVGGRRWIYCRCAHPDHHRLGDHRQSLFAHRWVSWVTNYVMAISDRVIFRTGVIPRRGIETPLGHVNNVLFNQSLLERLIGAGDSLIESGGESGQQTFTDVRSPDRVQNSIHAAIEELRNS